MSEDDIFQRPKGLENLVNDVEGDQERFRAAFERLVQKSPNVSDGDKAMILEVLKKTPAEAPGATVRSAADET
jgi:hypothetical protein